MNKFFRCLAMVLVMLYVVDSIEVNSSVETLPTHHWDEPCYNSSDRTHTIKWKSVHLDRQLIFDSEFNKIVMGNRTKTFYVAVRLYGRILAADSTVIARLDNSLTHSFWEFSKAESNMPGFFMSVDDEEDDMYLYYKKNSNPKHHVIVLDPINGKVSMAKIFEFKQELEMVNFYANSCGTLYFTAISSNNILLCKYTKARDKINCTYSNFPGFKANRKQSLKSSEMIQIAFDNSIILSVYTSYNNLNFTVLKYDYDLSPLSNSSIIIDNFTNPITSIKFYARGV